MSAADIAAEAARIAAGMTLDPLNLTGVWGSAPGRTAGQIAGSAGAAVGSGTAQFGAGFASGLGSEFRKDPIDTTIGFGVIGGAFALALGIAYAVNRVGARRSYY